MTARRLAGALATCCLVACVGTTGGQLVDFPAAAAGPVDAPGDGGGPLEFTTDSGWHVALTRATLHIGALYLNDSRPVSGAQATECILSPSTYVAEVIPPGGLDVDLLSPTPQPFAQPGRGTTGQALVGQVWLNGGDINEPSDTTTILDVAGTADDGAGANVAFQGQITIGTNRVAATTSGAAGGDPICKERIVSVFTSVVVAPTGGLLLRVDPRALFAKIDFGALTSGPGGASFSDDPTSAAYTAPSAALYRNLHSAGSLYTFSWSDGF